MQYVSLNSDGFALEGSWRVTQDGICSEMQPLRRMEYMISHSGESSYNQPVGKLGKDSERGLVENGRKGCIRLLCQRQS